MTHEALPPDCGHVSGQPSDQLHELPAETPPPPSRVQRKRTARAAIKASAELPDCPFSLVELLMVFR